MADTDVDSDEPVESVESVDAGEGERLVEVVEASMLVVDIPVLPSELVSVDDGSEPTVIETGNQNGGHSAANDETYSTNPQS